MNLSALIASLTGDTRDALESAAGACLSRGGYEIGIEDYMDRLLPLPAVQDILVQFGRNGDRLAELLEKGRQRAAQGRKTSGRPVFSPLLIEFLQEAYLLASLEMGLAHVSAGVLVLALLRNPTRYGVMPFFAELEPIPADQLQRLLEGLGDTSGLIPGGPRAGSVQASSKTGSMLQKYTTDFTEEARQGKIDAVFARGPEIRQIADTLTRRRKNNPILVGDPGVGKTAVVEGLALKIAQNDVPDALKNTRIMGLDMGALQAGAGVKGEFEKRLKGVIDEVKASPVPTILFIDEAHTLVGSGNTAGSGDGANLLKPALARGELRTIAATTWSEYKKYFEKDAALARRFQLIKLDEPSPADTITILRGIVPSYEKSHGVYIRDDAVVKTAELASRYIAGRFLPDKAIDVMDTACARVRVSMGAKPAVLETLEEDLAAITRELAAIERDRTRGTVSEDYEAGRLYQAKLTERSMSLSARIDVLRSRWRQERDLVRALLELRGKEHREVIQTPPAEEESEVRANDAAEGSMETAALSTYAKIEQLTDALRILQGDDPLLHYEVSPELIGSIVAESTGIPVGKLGADESAALANLGSRLKKRIKGQDHAIAAIEKAVLASKTGLNDPSSPTGIFLFVGPSGVGKTETALAVADELFGGERQLISINMSEFQEKHTISRLIGSPPGYVGYGEGGRLTEAIRRQPYSAVLFDEVEKAHPDVLNLFYQMFDKGVLADGEGREINFRNTMIFMTSNLGGDIIAALHEDGEAPEPTTLYEAIRPALAQFFKPALLGRMTIVPYAAIQADILHELVQMKLAKVAERLTGRHRTLLAWSPRLVDSIVASCTAVDTGARNIDHIITASLLPSIATTLLGSLSSGEVSPRMLAVDIDPQSGIFTCTLRNRE
jgi:type VI secretion system protein VasG